MAKQPMGLLGFFGIIVLVFSGGCTLFVAEINREMGAAALSDYTGVLLTGGIPFVLGLLMLFFDYRMRRAGRDVDDASQ
jgi:uncharacterized membrane protein